MSEPVESTILTDMQLDVRQRLTQLAEWQTVWQQEDALLSSKLQDLNPEWQRDLQRGVQLTGLRRRLSLRLVRKPLAITAETVQAVGYPVLRRQMAAQFANLTKSERLLWLNNFLFILTPDLRQLSDKIAKVRTYRAFGQRRNFLLGGPSGMGKTTFLNWLTINELPVVERDRNHVPIIKIDAPVSNHTPKPLFQRILQECGATYTMNDNEEVLLMKLILYFQRCGVDLLIVDEVEHITRPELRRRLLELTNLTHGAPIICASCHPLRWIEGDSEVQGRWNDYFKLEQYTGQRLSQLLAFLELLLPFTDDSFLAGRNVPPGAITEESGNGSARLIEQWTGGILQDIMLLLLEASVKAIQQNLTRLSPLLLEESWQAIQTRQVTDFLAILQRQNLTQVGQVERKR
jgi:hypothetical protein